MKSFKRLVMDRTSKPASDGLTSPRVQLHQPVKELVAFVERAHADALVETVHAPAVGVAEHAVHPVGWNAGVMVKRPSVAPASSAGTTGTPGHICELTASTGPTISRVSGGGGEGVGSCVGVILILSFARTRARVFCTSATGSPGRMRQFTVARARCGRALVACPASSIVATQVVRKVELLSAVADSRAIASGSGGSRRIAFISDAACPVSMRDICSK